MVRGLSLVAARRLTHSLVVVPGLAAAAPSGSAVAVPELQSTSSVAVVHRLSFLWHVRSSLTRGQTVVPFITRQILNH